VPTWPKVSSRRVGRSPALDGRLLRWTRRTWSSECAAILSGATVLASLSNDDWFETTITPYVRYGDAFAWL
jgi:hypothetical protein